MAINICWCFSASIKMKTGLHHLQYYFILTKSCKVLLSSLHWLLCVLLSVTIRSGKFKIYSRNPPLRRLFLSSSVCLLLLLPFGSATIGLCLMLLEWDEGEKGGEGFDDCGWWWHSRNDPDRDCTWPLREIETFTIPSLYKQDDHGVNNWDRKLNTHVVFVFSFECFKPFNAWGAEHFVKIPWVSVAGPRYVRARFSPSSLSSLLSRSSQI